MEEKPITKFQAKMNGIMAVIHLCFYYGIVMGIWGLALNKNFITFVISGVCVGLVFGLIFTFPAISMKRTEETSKETMFAVGAVWGSLALIFGILGIIVWIIRIIFFN